VKTIEVKILWKGSGPLPEEEYEYHNRLYRFVRVDRDADLRIFDARRWASLEEAIENYHGVTIPTLVIAPDTFEAEWLRRVLIVDQVLRESAIDGQFGISVARFAIQNHERKKFLLRSFTDPLTKLLPRNDFSRRLQLELDLAEGNTSVALVMLDMDHFKEINDSHGYKAGDRSLRAVSDLLKQSMHGENAIYRIGGEEFAIITRMNQVQAEGLADYIRTEIMEIDTERFAPGLQLSASFGVAVNSGTVDSETLIGEADRALYAAKAAGRNRVELAGEISADLDPAEALIKDFENRIRVLSERLTSMLSSRSRELVSRLAKEADQDGLTALFNRGYFDRRMSREFEKVQGGSGKLALIFLDIDHFGKVNKTYGWPTGDRALQQVAEVLRNSVRTVDWTARYGGEELCAVLPDTDEETACEVARRIWREVAAQPVQAYDGREVRLSISVGVAQYDPERDGAVLDFIQRTSERTRFAKEHGRNQVCCSDTAVEDRGED
jgi:two-component system cell cycle response regulator